VIVTLNFYFKRDCIEMRKLRWQNEVATDSISEHHTNNIREVEIISVTYKNSNYIIEWENKENCEKGRDEVDDQNGDIKMVEATIC
jgi:hypothetical protein